MIATARKSGSAAALVLAASLGVGAAIPNVAAARFAVPARAEQLIVVSSPTDNPPDYLATLRTYERSRPGARWHAVSGPWQAETGSGHLLPSRDRREGDHATPIGVFPIGHTIYGLRQNPGGLHYGYHRLVCGDWWDEDPYSPRYNQFVWVPCGITPGFAAWSEALWTETVASTYFAVIRFNLRPTVGGANALGSGIFLHSWVGGATEGCVALPEGELLKVLRWLRPAAHPVIEIGTDGQVSKLPRR